MASTIVVLWIYFSQPWHFGPIPMTPGWASAQVFFDREGCEAAVSNGHSPMVCLPPGASPGSLLARADRGRSGGM